MVGGKWKHGREGEKTLLNFHLEVEYDVLGEMGGHWVPRITQGVRDSLESWEKEWSFPSVLANRLGMHPLIWAVGTLTQP